MRYLMFLLTILFFHCNFMIEAPKRDNPLDPKNPKNAASNSGNQTGVVKNGLFSWWKFNGNTNDEINAKNFTGGTISYSADRFGNSGNALNSPSGGTMTAGTATDFETPPFTLEFWILFTTLPVSGVETLLENYLAGGCTSTGFGYRIVYDSGMPGIYLDACFTNNSFAFLTTPAISINQNQWYHVFAEVETNKITLYIYAKNSDTYTSQTNSISVGVFQAASSSLLSIPTPASGAYILDDLRYYPRLLTPEEKLQNHNSTEF
ncbi:MAG: hypothetical protein D6767_06825 [Candidatus Hydrogenedentota bacterium]|nr:MAG: hypothetical protein D6767_06825 [Candidatus Hydrogenedentota bacterium]